MLWKPRPPWRGEKSCNKKAARTVAALGCEMHAILGRREIVRAVIKSGDVDHLVHDEKSLTGLLALGKRAVGCFPCSGVMQLLPEAVASA